MGVILETSVLIAAERGTFAMTRFLQQAADEPLAVAALLVLFVALEMLEAPEYDLSTLANSLQDLLRRGRSELALLESRLQANSPLPRLRQLQLDLQRLRQLLFRR